jgi:Zn-dependent M28 family amino/carboxypeptidase
MKRHFAGATLLACCGIAFAAELVTPAEQKAARAITPELLRGHIRFLASDLLEGRGPATRGDALTQAYIQAQMEALGLKPGAPDGGWLQKFDIVGINSHTPDKVSFRRGSDKLELRNMEDFIGYSGVQAPEAELKDAEVVFVGYGITAPEYQWNDFKDADLKGKVLLVMNNDPDHSAAGDPALFAGKTRLYYGRWDYKYDTAAKQGAAGAIIIHTDASAAYKWQVVQSSWTGEQFELPYESGPQMPLKSWTTEEASRRLARLGGFDLDQLRASAEKRDFKPVPLGVKLSLKIKNDISRKQTANVIGKLVGSDARLAGEGVFLTAHHDHLGIVEGARPGADVIYNGALDNASGIAALLAIARSTTLLPQAPKRSLYFAAVAAEEQGLLGSEYLAKHPPMPAGRIAADINMDSMNIWGRTRDLVAVGLGKSSLDTWVKKLAAMQNRVVVGDQFPEKGSYYRSDQFNFARIGVPGAYLRTGSDAIGKPAGWGKQKQQEHEDLHYHQPSDELRDDWDLAGMVEDAQLTFWLSQKIANDPKLPAWTPGDEFEATRKKALAEVGK